MSGLNTEEAAILKAFEEGRVTSSADAENIRTRHQQYAKTMADSTPNPSVEIQLPADDLQRLQEQADSAGIPREALIASILHQYVTSRSRDGP